MRVLRYADLDSDQRRALFDRAGARMFAFEVQEQVEDLLRDVRDRGDAATLDALEKYDGVRLDSPGDQRVSEEEFEAAFRQTEAGLVKAIRAAVTASRAYNERSVRGLDWTEEISSGVLVGERYTPIESAGLYVPCGKGSFPSVLVLLGTPAVVAGVPKLAVVVPPLPGTGGRGWTPRCWWRPRNWAYETCSAPMAWPAFRRWRSVRRSSRRCASSSALVARRSPRRRL